jgi:hypothetical protein
MQVVCGNCQLTFDAPEGTTGLVCPICRSPLQAPASAGDAAAGPAASKVIDWNGGSLSDLIALLSAPAASARVEVVPLGSDVPVGEVHLLAGGVSDAIYNGQATDDALDRLFTVTPARFRVEPRLPHPKTGDMGQPGPESGTLDGRPLAHLMRYCEDYVITCQIEVWRGNENARVDYRRGEIAGVTVGGIDAPERLAEVMQWSSGNYRLNVPPITLPPTAPKHAPTPSPSAVAAAQAAAARQSSATKTMFGIPQSEIAAARAAAEAIMAAQGVGAAKPSPLAAPEPAPAPSAFTAPAPIPMPVAITPPGVAPSAVPSPLAAARASASATKTMFGVPAPSMPGGFIPGHQVAAPAPVPAPAPSAPVVEAATPETASTEDTTRTDRVIKAGARKVAVPAPELVAPAAAPPAAKEKDPNRVTHQGFDAGRGAKKPASDERAEKPGKPSPPAKTHGAQPSAGTGIWMYAGVGFIFGLALLGIYYLVGQLAH